VVFAVGGVARVLAARLGPALYPDAYFQYLEPAWLHLTGLGVKTWEWNDGVRSWVLPGFHGAWLALGLRLGLSGSLMGEVVRLSWGLFSLLLVWAAWRAGNACARQLRPRAACCTCGKLRFQAAVPLTFVGDAPPGGWQGGLAAAALVAVFPLLAIYSVEPLTELPSMIALVVAFALCAELREMDAREGKGRAALIGALLSLAVCLRVVNAVLVLVPVVWLGSGGRWRDLAIIAGTALLPVLFFGLVDLVTWGDYFHSFIAHLKFNLVDGRAVQYGKEPVAWYLTTLGARLPWGLALLALPALWGLRATWPFVLSALGFMACISSQAHKEERFAIVFWPLLLIAAGIVVGRWMFPDADTPQASPRVGRWTPALLRARQGVLVLGLLVVAIDSGSRLRGIDFTIPHARLDGQAWVARQPGATGLLIDWQYGSGGYLWLGRSIPQVEYAAGLLSNPLFSHVLAGKGSGLDTEARSQGFQPKFDRGGVVVLERTMRN
jgi:hypothetical protein